MDSLQSLIIIQIFSFHEGRKKLHKGCRIPVNSPLCKKERAAYRSFPKNRTAKIRKRSSPATYFPFVFDVPIEGVPKKSRLPQRGTGGGDVSYIYGLGGGNYVPTDGILYAVYWYCSTIRFPTSGILFGNRSDYFFYFITILVTFRRRIFPAKC